MCSVGTYVTYHKICIWGLWMLNKINKIYKQRKRTHFQIIFVKAEFLEPSIEYIIVLL